MRDLIYLFALVLLIATCSYGCGHAKIVVKKCEKTQNADIYVCEQL